jgi:hypothetical protein
MVGFVDTVLSDNGRDIDGIAAIPFVIDFDFRAENRFDLFHNLILNGHCITLLSGMKRGI